MIAISFSEYSRSSPSSSADRALVRAADLILPEGAIHQQADQLRIGQERAAVGVVG